LYIEVYYSRKVNVAEASLRILDYKSSGGASNVKVRNLYVSHDTKIEIYAVIDDHLLDDVDISLIVDRTLEGKFVGKNEAKLYNVRLSLLDTNPTVLKGTAWLRLK